MLGGNFQITLLKKKKKEKALVSASWRRAIIKRVCVFLMGRVACGSSRCRYIKSRRPLRRPINVYNAHLGCLWKPITLQISKVEWSGLSSPLTFSFYPSITHIQPSVKLHLQPSSSFFFPAPASVSWCDLKRRDMKIHKPLITNVPEQSDREARPLTRWVLDRL